eukprot:gene8056-16514_t
MSARFRFNDAMSDDGESSIGAGSVISESFYKLNINKENFKGPQRSGYLYKMVDIGTYKRRYFETTGFYLTYYKSKKKIKLLAALNMRKVDRIELMTENPGGPYGEDLTAAGCFFQIEVNGNIYVLRGASPSDTLRWILVLNDLKNGVETDSLDGFEEGKTGEMESLVTAPAAKNAKSNKSKRGFWDGYISLCCFA